MGATMALWLLARFPHRFERFVAVGMGSAFEPWELDDGGVDRAGLAKASGTRTLLVGDLRDPSGGVPYFEENRRHLVSAGFDVQVWRPDEGTHDLTDEIRDRAVAFLSSGQPRGI